MILTKNQNCKVPENSVLNDFRLRTEFFLGYYLSLRSFSGSISN
jgi:hypothetical protein